ncbi:MAG TPA: DUF1906 domain-containing protein, partial [Solirubrobacterales bacterium]|nr:DUF1906 domain-containing protein [Solirubrobacterales bacterium]
MLLLAVVLAILAAPGVATAANGDARTIRFAGEEVRVPAGWPVIRLAERPTACVRLDLRIVYLGTPSVSQDCPASAAGRRRAIVVPAAATARSGEGEPAHVSRSQRVRFAGGGTFTGLGFDACAAPSRRAMRAWDSSPYRAVGVYIGGLNRACSQPNLTASWVGEQVAAGWHLIPTYVGLQAPTSSCASCAKLTPGAATLQGTAAANDAVEQAQAVAMGPGSPLYFDMESYSRTSSATSATLTFLEAWTERLHALGYESGVYSSGASGIADLVDRLGTTYSQPDHIWIANWDGRRTADDPYVPDYAWAQQQRIRQYRGGHDETWGGVTINIDNNYVEGGTVGGSAVSVEPKGKLDLVESPSSGQVRVTGWAFDPSVPGTPVSIRVYVGGQRGKRGAVRQELGPVAVQHRPDIATRFRASGGFGGFDVSFPTIKTGRERVCAYAVDIESGDERRIGCRVAGIAKPLSVWGVD